MIVPIDALEFEPNQVSAGDREGILAIISDRKIPGTLVKLFVSKIDGSYYAVTDEGETTNTIHIPLPVLTQKQIELGYYG